MLITNVMAVSLDGCIATKPLQNDKERRSIGFSSDEDREFVRQQILGADAIITGADSMRASRRAWNQVGRNERFPIWVVYSNRGLAPDLEFWQQDGIERWIVSSNPLKLPPFTGTVKNVVVEEPKNAARAVAELLRERGVEYSLLFGGGSINKIFYEAQLVDELKITICPVIVGSSDAPKFVEPGNIDPSQLRLLSSQKQRDHVFLHYSIVKKSA